jgi:hypothetical protein
MVDKKINWLQNWLFQNINDNWKKIFFLRNIENPGWSLTFHLSVNYQNILFQNIKIDRTDNDWCYCFIRDGKFEIRGGPFNLNEMLNYFINFFEEKKEINISIFNENKIINWMQNWYYQQCDEDWENPSRFLLETTAFGWYFSVFLEESIYEEKSFALIEVKKSEKDWYSCCRTKYRFEGKGGIFNLIDILNVFINWIEDCKN